MANELILAVDDEAHILFGGDWKIYKLDEIPVEIIGGNDAR